jgi:hypothetical protein
VSHQELVWQAITALVTILTVVASYLRARTDRRAQHVETTSKLDEVQTTVNGQTEQLQARIVQLTAALTDASVDVPPVPARGG